jgi:hypothetical protein
MSRSKKTFDVAALLTESNRLLALPDSEHTTAEWRKGVATTLEHVLHATGNYEGYNFLDWLNGGYDKWIADGRPESTTPYLGDETRRVYYGNGTRNRVKLSEFSCPKNHGVGFRTESS